MQKNWYIIYTKPKCEKKIATLLTKRKIENFCPFNCKLVRSPRKSKLFYEPLFDSYVFAYIAEEVLALLKQMDYILSIVYWKGEPAKVSDEEIEAIKEFTTDHQNIKLEKTKVNVNDVTRIIDGPMYSMDGQVLTVKNKTIKVNLPSLGFIMVAEMDTERTLGKGLLFSNKEFLLQ